MKGLNWNKVNEEEVVDEPAVGFFFFTASDSIHSIIELNRTSYIE